MGNEGSRNQLSGLVINEKAFEVTDNWTLYSATYNSENNPKVSVFIEATQDSSRLSPLHLYAKNLMLHRHPCILKYIASWSKSGKLYLATEDVRPLSHVINSQTPLQLCIGLFSILKALMFLHDQACAAHLNVCKASIYVTSDGSWKLGGLEFLKRFQDLTLSYLQETRSKRYMYGISPNEDDRAPQPPTIIDQYAFGVLADEVLQGKTNNEIPAVLEFKETCINRLRSQEPKDRPPLNQVMEHPFFTHKFIAIHTFLTELAIKSPEQKANFFKDLAAELSMFQETLVASQLGALLLSRLVLLDSTAQTSLLPHLLTPRSDEYPASLFSSSVFVKFIVPKLLSIFCVRDAQVRLTLLRNFNIFSTAFSQQQLQLQILPELLVGIKDTSDEIVSATLHVLADLVPILGASVVIGSKRCKLFADGRPKACDEPDKVSDPTKKMLSSESTEQILHERPSPDGGEDFILELQPTVRNGGVNFHQIVDDEQETWINWESPLKEDYATSKTISQSTSDFSKKGSKDPIKMASLNAKPKDFNKPNEIDILFRDMEPVICKPTIVDISQEASSLNKFNVLSEDHVEDGWGDDIDDWGSISDENVEPSNQEINITS